MAETAELKSQQGPTDDALGQPDADPTRQSAPSEPSTPEGASPLSPAAARAPGMVFLAGATILSLVCGMIGACLALNLFESSSHGLGPRRPAAGPEVSAVQARIDELAKRTETLKTRYEGQPEGPTAADVSALQGKVSELAKTETELVPLAGRVAQVDSSLERIAASIEALREDMSALRSKVAKLDPAAEPASFAPVVTPAADEPEALEESVPAEAVPAPPPSRRVAPTAGRTPLSAKGPTLTLGVDLFNKGQYARAREIFNQLGQTDPNDARVWYYAALSTGFATNEWVERTERLVEKGLERERAGTPDASTIDSTFGHLTLNTGRDWLAAYRSRIKSR